MSTSEEMVADDIQVPSTPPRLRTPTGIKDSDTSNVATGTAQIGSMTPPPSTHPRRVRSPLHHGNAMDSLTTSPTTIARINASSNLPTADKIATANIDELRTMVQDLVDAVTEARMSAAHFKLQHTLLAMEKDEAAQRAEIEQQMTRREVEVLQAAEQRHRAAASATPRPRPASPQPQILALTKTCKDLEDERDDAEDQLLETKKYLEYEKDRAELLTEQNILLKKRIRENREHFTKLKDQSPLYVTPRQAPFTTPRRKSYSRFPESTPAHDNFAALLYADQMLSQETASVPSTPTKSQAARVRHGHTRGAHSLSSLQTPSARRPMTADGLLGPVVPATAPGSQLVNESAERERHGRDSTISISDAEEEGSNEDIAQSQASSLATSMLRKNPASQETLRQSQEVERSSNLLQSKLFGPVKKASTSKGSSKRGREYDETIRMKKSKLNEGVGLGVRMEI